MHTNFFTYFQIFYEGFRRPQLLVFVQMLNKLLCTSVVNKVYSLLIRNITSSYTRSLFSHASVCLNVNYSCVSLV